MHGGAQALGEDLRLGPVEAIGFNPWRDRTADGKNAAAVLEALNLNSMTTEFAALAERGAAMFISELPRGMEETGEGQGLQAPLGAHGPGRGGGAQGFYSP